MKGSTFSGNFCKSADENFIAKKANHLDVISTTLWLNRFLGTFPGTFPAIIMWEFSHKPPEIKTGIDRKKVEQFSNCHANRHDMLAKVDLSHRYISQTELFPHWLTRSGSCWASGIACFTILRLFRYLNCAQILHNWEVVALLVWFWSAYLFAQATSTDWVFDT